MNFYIDTSALFAIVDADDEHHVQAGQSWRELLRQNHLLIVNNYVLLETITLLQRRIGIQAVNDFQRTILPILFINWVGEAEHEAALNILLSAGLRNLSLVDCSSFGTMRRLGVRSVFAFDSHFTEQGFDCIP